MRETVMAISRVCGLATIVLTIFAAGASGAAPRPDKADGSAEAPFGAYLAGRHAQHMRD